MHYGRAAGHTTRLRHYRLQRTPRRPLLAPRLALAAACFVLAGGLIAACSDSMSDERICSVHDGDTVTTCDGEHIRIRNIDAPEMPGSPKCPRGWCDYALAIEARDYVQTRIAGSYVIVKRYGADRYGRTLATINVHGRDLGNELIARGLARRWK